MMKGKLLVFLFCTSIFFACKKDFWGKKSCDGNENAQSISHNSENREYKVYVPDLYDGSSALPIVFNFHGFGGTIDEYETYADMRSVANEENFILIYPQGTCLDGFAHWNPSLPSSDNKSSADDLGFIEALINDVSSEYNIDQERIYACGYSNGGMMAYGLACQKSNLFAAVGSVSGTMLDFACPLVHSMPVISIHGTDDAVIAYNGNSDYNSVDIVLDYWNEANNTVVNNVSNSSSQNGIEHYVYGQGDNDVSVEHFKIVEGEHVWFDVSYQGMNTSELIWDFFSNYDINGLR